MNLAELHIHFLRNLHSIRAILNPHLNFICGNNGSGKTSFLEAIYLLSSGHSFRSRESANLISFQHDQLTVFAKTIDDQTISIQKSLRQSTVARINNQPCFASSYLANFLPCQVFYQDIFFTIDAGPAYRRAVLDWGLFHVEQSYHEIWKDYRRALKQRNALLKLKQKNLEEQLAPWNKILSDLGERLDLLRQPYFEKLADEFQIVLKKISDLPCSLSYYKGWDRRNEGITLEEILQKSYDTDLHRQFTHYGAHQADILISHDYGKAKNFLSRGQQKIILFALKIAQAKLLKKTCLFLIDDMTAELDKFHVDKLMSLFYEVSGQYFITVRSGDHLIELSRYNDAKKLLLEKGCLLDN